MNKLAIQETFPPGIVGREIVLAQMCHHYRRISSAKARVDTNLFKPAKPSLSRPLSAEVSSIVQRSLSPRSPPKHRKCLKYENEISEFHFKPTLRSQGVESRLRSTPEVYHPAVKPHKTNRTEHEAHQQATQTSLENSLAEEEPPKTRDEAVQTSNQSLYRPVDLRSVQFLRDITNDALQQRAFTSASLNRIFLEHQFRNAYSLTQELMDRELEELRRQLGMLPRHHQFAGTVSDAEALDALDSLVLDPRIKEQVIQSLRLSRDNDSRKRGLFKYFDRLKGDEDEQELPCKEMRPESSHLSGQPEVEDSGEPLVNEKVDVAGKLIDPTNNGQGWDAEVDEEDRPITTDSSSEEEEKRSSDSPDNDEEVVESLSDSDEENGKPRISESPEVETSDEEITQRESTASKLPETDGQPETDGRSETSKYHDLDKDDTDQDDSNNETDVSEIIGSTKSKVSIDNALESDKSLSHLLPLKLEPLTAKGDKWKTSLEAVKEEPDSTAGQISDLSTASTPSDEGEGENEVCQENVTPSRSPAGTSGRIEDSPPSGTYHSVESIPKTSSSAAQQSTTSSTGREIVLGMADLLAGNDGLNIGAEMEEIVEHDEDPPKVDADEGLSESIQEVEEDVETVKEESGGEDEGEESDNSWEIETVQSGSDSDSDTDKGKQEPVFAGCGNAGGKCFRCEDTIAKPVGPKA